MNLKRLTILSDILILVGFVLLGVGWKGSASVTGGIPFHSSSVQFTGGASGFAALLGVPSLFFGFALMLITLVWTSIEVLQK